MKKAAAILGLILVSILLYSGGQHLYQDHKDLHSIRTIIVKALTDAQAAKKPAVPAPSPTSPPVVK